jgi:hypothetical protein
VDHLTKAAHFILVKTNDSVGRIIHVLDCMLTLCSEEDSVRPGNLLYFSLLAAIA